MTVRNLRFPILLLVYLGGLAWLMRTVFRGSYDAVSASLSVAMAQVVHSVMGLVAETSLDGVFVSYAGFPVKIVPECVGIYEMLIFSACVLAYPAPWRAKLVGLPLGAIVIFLFNLVRIIGLLLVGRHQPELFEFFHLYFWQSTLVVVVAAVWLGWLQLVVRRWPA